jgi:hypothetical protein
METKMDAGNTAAQTDDTAIREGAPKGSGHVMFIAWGSLALGIIYLLGGITLAFRHFPSFGFILFSDAIGLYFIHHVPRFGPLPLMGPHNGPCDRADWVCHPNRMVSAVGYAFRGRDAFPAKAHKKHVGFTVNCEAQRLLIQQ